MTQKRVGIEPFWKSSEKESEATRLIEFLLAGSVNRIMPFMESKNGRFALRGFDFSMRAGEHQFQDFTPNGVSRAKEGNQYQNLAIGGLDICGSLFSNTKWTDCIFHDCLFNRCDFYMARFEGCTFERVRFEDSWLQNCSLGHISTRNSGRFTDVEFVRGVFSRVYFSYPLFERCHFKCKLDNIDFDGSQFLDCSFEGILDAVSFYGTYNRSEELMKTLGRRKVPFNPMRNIDFSRATFHAVAIRNGIDLTTCKFPPDGVLYIRNNEEIFAEVARRIELKWTGEERERGVRHAVSYGNRRANPDGVIYIRSRRYNSWPEELQSRFYSELVNVVNERATIESQYHCAFEKSPPS